ncbi:MAG: DinB family protein [Vicinamibacterales bacterium]|nr:DinB family protein [Vicinamibacterales bacterium]
MSAKQQYAGVYARERATTLKVLKAFPADKSSFKPHDRSSSALQLAWTFVIENNIAMGALHGPLDLSAGFPPVQGTYSDILHAYEASGRDLLAALEKTPDSRLSETVNFFTGPKQMGAVPVGDLLWVMLMDSIHHRGQLSVYIRLAGGKVPSIYGPSADEPWN